MTGIDCYYIEIGKRDSRGLMETIGQIDLNAAEPLKALIAFETMTRAKQADHLCFRTLQGSFRGLIAEWSRRDNRPFYYDNYSSFKTVFAPIFNKGR